MVHLIKQVNHLLMERRLEKTEVKLVRKKLNWKHEPFEIPKEILLISGRKIGEKGLLQEKKWNYKFQQKK